ncbi:hypothetical protein EVJ58_g5231 [Rhodofomes roseus]|uniref:Uncharacterized protein n=1 Tax=Rhodofomes roseus TaxID=34475 RepID=A0A4Y9YEN2_9APHY|nr:hypothetical protein EVJ58_g5231 [Rhodofomes roseus]
MSTPAVDLTHSAPSAGPSFAQAASPVISSVSSPSISSAAPGDAKPTEAPESISAASAKQKAKKKKKKRLTEDDFILADLADWESARASKASQPASPSTSIASIAPPIKADLATNAQAEPQTPREGSVPGPSGSRASGTPVAAAPEVDSTMNGTAVPPVTFAPAPGPAPALSKQTTTVPAISAEATPAPAAAAPAADRAPPTPILSISLSPNRPAEVDLRAQMTAPSSPKSTRKKRPSQEFHIVPESMSSTSKPLKRKKNSPGLMVVRLNPPLEEGRSGAPQANGSATEPVAANGQAGQRDGSLPHPPQTDKDVVMEDSNGAATREPKAASVDLADAQMIGEASGVPHQQEQRPEPQQQPTSDNGQPQPGASESAVVHSPEPPSEDIVMGDRVQSPEADPARLGSQPMEIDSIPFVGVAVKEAAEEPAMDVVREPAPGQSDDRGSSAVSVNEAPSATNDNPHTGVASAELPAPGQVHPQPQGVVDHRVDDITAEPSLSTDQPYEGVIQELADQKGMSGDIVSRIVDAVAQDTRPDGTDFKLAPAEWPTDWPTDWPTETRSPTPSESTVVLVPPSGPAVPRKRSRSQSHPEDDVEDDARRKRRTKSSSPTPAPHVAEDDHPAPETAARIDDQPVPVQVAMVSVPEPAPASDDGHPDSDSASTSEHSTPEPTVTGGPPASEESPTEAMQGVLDTQQASPADAGAEFEQTMEIPSRVPDNVEVQASTEDNRDKEEGEADETEVQAPRGPPAEKEEGEADEYEEPPITISNIPSPMQQTVEEGEIQLPALPPPQSTTLSIPSPHIDLNKPLAYSELCILDCRRGSSESMMAFEFNVDAELMTSLSRWVGRYKSADDVSQAKCVSFSCYPFNDCVDYIRARSNGADSSYEKLCRGVVMKWPRDGRLWAELTNSSGEHRITLSPPLMVSTPQFDSTMLLTLETQRKTEQVVDLSEHVTLGKNVMHVYQLRDHSDSVFTLNIHTPVDSQLQELQQRRNHAAKWKGFLHTLTVFEFPEFPWNRPMAMVEP